MGCRTQMSFTIYYIYNIFKKYGYIGCPKKRYRRPPSAKQKTPVKPPQSPHHERSLGQARPGDPDHPNRAKTARGTPALVLPLESPQSEPRDETRNADFPVPSPKPMHPANSPRPGQPLPENPSLPKPRPGQGNPEIQQKSPAPPPIKRHQTSPRTPGTAKFPINYSTFKCGKSCATSWLLLCMVPNLYLISGSLLAISFLKIKIAVNFKNLFV